MRNLSKIGAGLAAAALLLAGCGASNTGGGGDGGTETDDKWTDCKPGQDAAAIADAGDDAKKDIKVGVFNGWDESFATAHLLKAALESDGYTVELQPLDAGPAFTALAQGDIDVVTDGWLPLTHADYLEQYGDDIEATGCWYDNAKLTIAVNEDSPAQSIADLKDNADAYGKRIVGIEAGAGLTRTTEEAAIPTYGLEDWEFVVSSTPAMLAELKRATDAGDDIVVTLWRPHWAYDAYPIRDLEDPEGSMGGAELIYNFTSKGFNDENPRTAQLLKNLVLDDEHLASLENLMFSAENYNGENLEQATADWLKENPDFLDKWRNGEL